MEQHTELSFLFHYINRKSDKYVNDRLKKYDITHSQQVILGYIHHAKQEYVIQKDIEDFFHISNPTVSGILKRLEQKGFIERKSDPSDKRSKIIVLTPKEQELHDDIVRSNHELDEYYDSILTRDEKMILLDLLQKISSNLSQLDDFD